MRGFRDRGPARTTGRAPRPPCRLLGGSIGVERLEALEAGGLGLDATRQCRPVGPVVSRCSTPWRCRPSGLTTCRVRHRYFRRRFEQRRRAGPLRGSKTGRCGGVVPNLKREARGHFGRRALSPNSVSGWPLAMSSATAVCITAISASRFRCGLRVHESPACPPTVRAPRARGLRGGRFRAS